MTMSPMKKKAKESSVTAMELDPANQEDDNDMIMTDAVGSEWSTTRGSKDQAARKKPVKVQAPNLNLTPCTMQ